MSRRRPTSSQSGNGPEHIHTAPARARRHPFGPPRANSREEFIPVLLHVLESFVSYSQSSNPFLALRTLRLLNVSEQSSQLERLAGTLGRLKDSGCSAREVVFTRCDFGVAVDPNEVSERVCGARIVCMVEKRDAFHIAVQVCQHCHSRATRQNADSETVLNDSVSVRQWSSDFGLNDEPMVLHFVLNPRYFLHI